MTSKKRICFVCLGNIVRSPLAEHMFLRRAEDLGVEKNYEVASAGTSAWHVGESPDPRMRRVAASRGWNYDGKSQKFKSSDFSLFDIIIAMDLENKEDLLKMRRSTSRATKILLLREFDPLVGSNLAVPDPYYGGIHGFEETYMIIERSIIGLMDALESGEV
ncbi:low molecular weight protein-tyrosine-phosphatase [Chloroflexota bacterium]